MSRVVANLPSPGLICNDVSHWLGASLEPALVVSLLYDQNLFTHAVKNNMRRAIQYILFICGQHSALSTITRVVTFGFTCNVRGHSNLENRLLTQIIPRKHIFRPECVSEVFHIMIWQEPSYPLADFEDKCMSCCFIDVVVGLNQQKLKFQTTENQIIDLYGKHEVQTNRQIETIVCLARD